MESRSQYQHPLGTRYGSTEMSYVWSEANKFSTWRTLWVSLAQAQLELGLQGISSQQVQDLRENINNIDFEFAEAKEKELRHDVMSHIHAFGEQCPSAMKIIHLGATSCFITDNTELIQIRSSLKLIRQKLLIFIKELSLFADKYKDLATLGFTHYQPAQLTTVGKRACLWLLDFCIDFRDLESLINDIPFRGVKGTTGTQASFLSLFDNNHDMVRKLDARVAELMEFEKKLIISGQTYTRKFDFKVVSVLSGIAQSAHKMGSDIRLLANLKEIEEPFGTNQVGSSAMAYKRNPMRCERMCSISRHLMSLVSNTMHTHANQWLERTLDDSANRRMTLPESFLSCDAVLDLAINVVSGLQVWPHTISKRVEAELPFMATENILMAAVKQGGDRQVLHETIRSHSMEAGFQIKQFGAENDLIARISQDEQFSCIKDDIPNIMNPKNFIGRSSEQVTEFIDSEVVPILQKLSGEQSNVSFNVNV